MSLLPSRDTILPPPPDGPLRAPLPPRLPCLPYFSREDAGELEPDHEPTDVDGARWWEEDDDRITERPPGGPTP